MTYRLTTNCAKNYCNRTLIVKVIVENVVTCFLGHSVYEGSPDPSLTSPVKTIFCALNLLISD